MAAISEEEFSRLQIQLLELRSQNYELSSKLQKTESNFAGLNEKCSTQEKEIQKLNKLPKFPGFQGLTKNKSKKDWADILEENERLNQQLQRQEEDFKLQNETLMYEVSQLSMVKEQISTNFEENEKLKCDINNQQNVIEGLRKELQSYQSTCNLESYQSTYSPPDTINTEFCNNILEKLQAHFKSISLKNSSLTMDNKENDNTLKDAEKLNELYNSIEKVCKHVVNGSTLRKEFNQENVQHKDEVASLEVKLMSLKETSTKEIARLTEEVNKWSEKAKRKQESFIKLQDEKENMYKENRITQEKLKENADKQLQVYVEKIKHLEEALGLSKGTREAENLLCRIDILSNENQAMQTEILSLREMHKENLSDNIKKLDENMKILQQEKELNDDKIKVLTEENIKLNKNQSFLEEELSLLKQEFSKANELAEKRKSLLDASSKELHSEAEAHRLKLEETKNKLGEDIRMLAEKNNAEVIELKSQIINHKKVKKELEELKSYSKVLEDQSKTLQDKLNYIQKDFADSEESNKRNTEKYINEINTMKESFEKCTEDIISKYCLQKENLEHSLLAMTVEKNDLLLQVEKLKESLKDKDVEHRILNKKNEQMIKELKKNLVTERKKAEQSQNKLQDFIQDIKVKNTYDEIFNPESLQVKAMSMHRRQDSGSLSVVSSSGGVDNEDYTSPKLSSPMGSSVNIANLSDETVDLITKVADLQQEKWVLEEKVRHLEESGSVMAEDLMQKSLIIQAYFSEHSGEVLPDRIPKTLTLKEKMFDKLKFNTAEELMKEKTTKMQQMLEETLAKNAQLQKDISYLTSLHSNKKNGVS